MILVDTSVLVDYLRSLDRKLLHLFGMHQAAVCGITRAEVLHGARGSQNRLYLVKSLNMFVQLPVTNQVWDLVGENLASLQANGLTFPFTDVVIASTAIFHDVELWTRDSHFTMMRKALVPLCLFVEPP